MLTREVEVAAGVEIEDTVAEVDDDFHNDFVYFFEEMVVDYVFFVVEYELTRNEVLLVHFLEDQELALFDF